MLDALVICFFFFLILIFAFLLLFTSVDVGQANDYSCHLHSRCVERGCTVRRYMYSACQM